MRRMNSLWLDSNRLSGEYCLQGEVVSIVMAASERSCGWAASGCGCGHVCSSSSAAAQHARLCAGCARAVLDALERLGKRPPTPAMAHAGPIPASWNPATFPNWGSVLLCVNEPGLTGPLPASWGLNGSFPIMTQLYLWNNQLTGEGLVLI